MSCGFDMASPSAWLCLGTKLVQIVQLLCLYAILLLFPLTWSEQADSGKTDTSDLNGDTNGFISNFLELQDQAIQTLWNGTVLPGNETFLPGNETILPGNETTGHVVAENATTRNNGQLHNVIAAGAIIGGILLLGITATAAIWYQYQRRHGQLTTAAVPCSGQGHNGQSRCIELHKFKEILARLLRDSALVLLEEFSVLRDATTTNLLLNQMIGFKENNIPKNRYMDIIPFDHTRVTLNGDRYINASFIRGFNRRREYIAAQGPMGEEDRKMRRKHSTLDDFFEMIWQYRVHCIVMLTQVIEAGRPKCAQYWPRLVGESVQHGVFTVRLISEIDYGPFWTRELELRRDRQRRTVFQYHYKDWTDMTWTDERRLLQFITTLRSSGRSTGILAPLLVHCSAGVGRTGVFIALDILLQHIQRHSYVDITSCVYDLRRQRVRMVQTEEQYVMLYRAVGLAIEDMLRLRNSSKDTEL